MASVNTDITRDGLSPEAAVVRYPKAFGRSFRFDRKLKGWTIEQAAQAVGVSVAQYSAVESGTLLSPEMMLMRGLATAYGYDLQIVCDGFKHVANALAAQTKLRA